MKRVLLALVVAAVTTLAFVSTALALDEPEVLRFVDVEETFTPLNFEFTGEEDFVPAPGDSFAFWEGLYAWDGAKRGKRVGRIRGLCTHTRVSLARMEATLYCTAEAKVPGGRILLAGFVTFSEEPGQQLVPVIGGTGRFDNARGTASFRDLRPGVSAVVFRLKP